MLPCFSGSSVSRLLLSSSFMSSGIAIRDTLLMRMQLLQDHDELPASPCRQCTPGTFSKDAWHGQCLTECPPVRNEDCTVRTCTLTTAGQSKQYTLLMHVVDAGLASAVHLGANSVYFVARTVPVRHGGLCSVSPRDCKSHIFK